MPKKKPSTTNEEQQASPDSSADSDCGSEEPAAAASTIQPKKRARITTPALIDWRPLRHCSCELSAELHHYSKHHYFASVAITPSSSFIEENRPERSDVWLPVERFEVHTGCVACFHEGGDVPYSIKFFASSKDSATISAVVCPFKGDIPQAPVVIPTGKLANPKSKFFMDGRVGISNMTYLFANLKDEDVVKGVKATVEEIVTKEAKKEHVRKRRAPPNPNPLFNVLLHGTTAAPLFSPLSQLTAIPLPLDQTLAATLPVGQATPPSTSSETSPSPFYTAQTSTVALVNPVCSTYDSDVQPIRTPKRVSSETSMFLQLLTWQLHQANQQHADLMQTVQMCLTAEAKLVESAHENVKASTAAIKASIEATQALFAASQADKADARKFMMEIFSTLKTPK